MAKNPNWDCYKNNSKYSSKLFAIIFKLMNKKVENLMKKVYSEFNSFNPDIMLNEGDSLMKYGFNALVYNTPGHTKGSISVVDKNGNLFCGDLFANNTKPTLAINAEDFDTLNKQAKRMYNLKIKKIYPGHGIPFDACKLKI